MVVRSDWTLRALLTHLFLRARRVARTRLEKLRLSLVYGGNKYQCSVCGSSARGFVSLRRIARGTLVRPVVVLGETIGPENYEFLNIENFACPTCGAPDKARLMAEFMQAEGLGRLQESGLPLLHFDPEQGMADYLADSPGMYLPTSWPEQRFENSFDITDLSALEEKIGGFICSHILEHVEEDSAAVAQLYKALVPGGFGIVLVPIIRSLQRNWEVEGQLSEGDRWRFFGQGDHVRIYSRTGLRNLLLSAGFTVRELGLEHFGREIFDRLALTDTSTLYVVEKPE